MYADTLWLKIKKMQNYGGWDRIAQILAWQQTHTVASAVSYLKTLNKLAEQISQPNELENKKGNK